MVSTSAQVPARALGLGVGCRHVIGTRSFISWRRARNLLARVGADTKGSETPDEAAIAFSELLPDQAGEAGVKLQSAAWNGRGLFMASASAPTSGKVLLSVPLDTCIVVDYANGLRVPEGDWPRLRSGVQKDDALPWDLLQALALLDGLAGAGDAFWARYTNDVLPPPLALTLPMCLPERLLAQLQHPAIEAGAAAQRARLAELFPGLAVPACEDGPTWLEWAFACVRSRAFRLGEQIFAFVPFLDAANHAAEPTADFQLSADASAVNLVALGPIAQGAEVTISYTGKVGYTNQRFMAQYGFVPRYGNPFDRLELEALGGGGTSTGATVTGSRISRPGERRAVVQVLKQSRR